MTIRSLLLVTLTAALYAAPVYAGTIESEPLPPPPGQQGSAGTPIPLTPRIGTGTSAAPSLSATTDGDNGMSGTSGASSAYDLGKPAVAPDTQAPVPQPDSQPAVTPDQSVPYKQPIRETQVVRMGIAPKDNPALENKKFCTLKISFGSIGTGVDGKTGQQIKSYLDANADKLTYTTVRWGREGEYDYCLDVPEHNNRAKLYTDIKRLLPANPPRGPITLSGAGFTTVTTEK